MILLTMFFTFFKIGLFTFGGGYAMLPLIEQEVLSRGWMSETALVNFIAVSESTPGPFAINIATYIGMENGGLPGAICCTLGVVLPSFLVILIVARIYDRFRQSRLVSGAMRGLKPGVIGLIGAAVLSVGQTVFFPQALSLSVFSAVPFYLSLCIAVACLGMAFRKVHPILIVVLSAAAGILAGYLLHLPV